MWEKNFGTIINRIISDRHTYIHVYSVLQCTVKEKAFSNRPVSNYQNSYLVPRLRGNKREEAKHKPSIFKPFFYRVIIMLGLKNKQEFQ